MNIYYDNPSMGSSEYSAHVDEGNYQCRITGINSDVNPQLVYVEITGGDETPPKPRYALTTTGKNIITGIIEWNVATQGYPTTNNWGEIFAIKCTVPKSFQVADNGSVLYNGERGYYMGSVQSGTVLFSNFEALPNNINRLSFSVINVADNLILNNFDVEIKDGNVWHAPANSNPPAPTYQYFAGTVLTAAQKLPTNNNYAVAFTIVSGWGDPTTGSSSNPELTNGLSQKKRTSVLPNNAFVINASANNAVMQNAMNSSSNAMKQNVNLQNANLQKFNIKSAKIKQ